VDRGANRDEHEAAEGINGGLRPKDPGGDEGLRTVGRIKPLSDFQKVVKHGGSG